MNAAIELYGATAAAAAVAMKNRDALVLANQGMVRRVALHLKTRIPPVIDVDELIQVGMMGLLEATNTYDPTKGIDFDNFAHARVRGAMLDEVLGCPPCPAQPWPSTGNSPRPPRPWPTAWAAGPMTGS